MIAVWTALLALAVLWPSRALSAFDGMPLSGTAEAVVIGVALPALWWLNRTFLAQRPAQWLIGTLVAVKLIAWAALPQQGLCARARAPWPIESTVSTIAVDEPAGVLRSWDVRADAWAGAPRCTAILDRAYESAADFPAWWRNLIAAVNPNATVHVSISGVVDVAAPGRLTIDTGRSMSVAGTIGATSVSAAGGTPITLMLPAGPQPVSLQASLQEGDWRFLPRWNGDDAWRTVRFTVTPVGRLGRLALPLAGAASTLLVMVLCAAWVWSCAMTLGWSRAIVGWAVVIAVAMAWCGATGHFERFAAILLLGAMFVPVSLREQDASGAFVLLGVPWLALWVARSWPLIGRVTMFTPGDDWQMYQLAAYRIVMNGYWIQGGSATFLFQPLYRWVVGILHLVFGDASVGEIYLDACCLLAAALLMVAVVKRLSGFCVGVAAGALTLVTCTVSSIWYLIGRSLSEIAGLGFMVVAAALLMRARQGSIGWAVAAGVSATLMFYTRLNHLLITGFLLVWLLPIGTRMAWRDLAAAAGHVRMAPVGAYAAVIAGGLVLFATRTWWYAGHFSVLYGTSFGAQQTGLEPSKMAEAVAAQLSMREPPAFDPRSLLVVAGAVAALLAAFQVPGAKNLPATLAIMTLGTIAGSLFAHTHDYPGRMSVHVVPFAVALTACAAARVAATRGLAHE